MILFSNAIPKSASTLVANQQCHLLSQFGIRSGQEELIASFDGRYIESPASRALLKVAYTNLRYGSCVVKCHWGKNRAVAGLMQAGLAKMTLCYRDPRDIVLSVLDHGKRSRAGNDASMAFAELQTFEDGIAFAEAVIQQFECWLDNSSVHAIRYESLMDNQTAELQKMCEFLKWPVERDVIERAVDSELNRKETAWNFNKGTAFRYRDEMSPEQIQLCNKRFSSFITIMGHEL